MSFNSISKTLVRITSIHNIYIVGWYTEPNEFNITRMYIYKNTALYHARPIKRHTARWHMDLIVSFTAQFQSNLYIVSGDIGYPGYRLLNFIGERVKYLRKRYEITKEKRNK